MKVRKIKNTDGSVTTIIENDNSEYVCEGYDAEDDITKPHSEIVCKVVDKDIKTDEALRED